MNFLKFAFSFLYVRNWHTGEKELSRPRLTLFFSVLFLILLALTIISVLQAPLYYDAP